jgi:hypothetical protein
MQFGREHTQASARSGTMRVETAWRRSRECVEALRRYAELAVG